MLGILLAVAALLALLAGIAIKSALLVQLGWILGGVVVVARVITWTSVRWVDLTRHTRAGRAEVGGLCEEVFRLRNRSWLPKLWLEVIDDSDLPDHQASRVVSALGPNRTRTWTARTICRRRGLYSLGPVTLFGGDPLGLFQAERHLPQTAPFTVYPRTLPLRDVDLPTGYLSGGQVVRRRAQYTTTNVRTVRPYEPGDAMNRIHWPTTARRQEIYAREFELDPVADFWLLLDLQRDAHTEPSEDSAPAMPQGTGDAPLPWLSSHVPDLMPNTEETAVTAAASLARHFLDRGRSVGLIAHGQRRVVVRPDRGERQVHKLLSSLAVLRAVGRTRLDEVLSAETNEFTRNTTLVIVSATTSLRWVEALRALRHRGVRSMVVCIEANTFGPAPSSLPVISALAAHNIPSRLIKNGDDIAAALGG
jgi:uncharacterized protein (DUF58 family)